MARGRSGKQRIQGLRKAQVKKGDMVMVIAGREKGKTGKVLGVSPRLGKVTVEKLNIIKRHTKPTQKHKQGGILEREAPFAISNVMVFSQGIQRPSRIGIKVLGDGRRVRILRKSPEEILDKV
ncbi:50S ribosomal protein L24 [Candidatus Nitronereus thalassa]|uniref:Large ribosomal subunit protein uL24 n=1 Tax=Candidatus Nitronereus thalassa TaxID=3020898 RepID=A0ABU3KBT2_9BACT|nr:50S ribosomal protein L24 [Candidatus Nitronereus thalassa]MDT7043846.1 50S ribosomal protein L24 [Candidatus Nitronereus thalassa]